MRDTFGNSTWAEHLRLIISRLASNPVTALIEGPTGTGKELIARALHQASERRGNRFVVVDCARLGDSLFASQMFGQMLSGGESSPGLFRSADGGTLLLDEIAELPLDLQAKMLRVLDERTVVPVGGCEAVPADVWVLASTNRTLSQEVAEGRFRSDLYYRLRVVSIQTPALKDRPEDIPVLATHFLAEIAQRQGTQPRALAPAAIEKLCTYDWPGNVRELKNVLEAAVTLTDVAVLDPECLTLGSGDHVLVARPAVARPAAVASSLRLHDEDGEASAEGASTLSFEALATDGDWPTAEQIEREHLRLTLERTGYNKSAAAKLLDMDRDRLHRRMIKLGLDMTRSKSGRPRNDEPARRAA